MDIDHFVASQIADDLPIMQGQDLAINLKDRLASFVQDGRVFTNTKELLADDIAHRVISLCEPALLNLHDFQ